MQTWSIAENGSGQAVVCFLQNTLSSISTFRLTCIEPGSLFPLQHAQLEVDATLDVQLKSDMVRILVKY